MYCHFSLKKKEGRPSWLPLFLQEAVARTSEPRPEQKEAEAAQMFQSESETRCATIGAEGPGTPYIYQICVFLVLS